MNNFAKLRIPYFLTQGEEIFQTTNEGIREQAEKIKEYMKKLIPYEEVPNAPNTTVKRKGFDSPLEESGRLHDQIIVISEARGISVGNAYTHHIQGNPDMLVETSDNRNHEGLTYAQLLEVLNDGTTSSGYGNAIVIPARPIIEHTFASLKDEMKYSVKMSFEEEVRKRLK